MFKRSLIAMVFTMTLPLSAQAGEFDYSYIELDSVYTDFAQSGVPENGYRLAASFELTDRFYVSADYQRTHLRLQNEFFDLVIVSKNTTDKLDLNVGYHQALNANNDFFAEVGTHSSKTEFVYLVNDELRIHGSSRNTSLQGSAGLRTVINDKWELLAQLGLYGNDGGDIDILPVAELGVAYKLTPAWALTFDTRMMGFSNAQYGLGVRAGFGDAKPGISSQSSSVGTAFNYTNFQVGLSGFERIYDGSWVAGYDVRGSYGFADHFYVHARYAQYNTAELDLGDEKQYEFGLGFHAKLTPSNDFLVDISRGVSNSGCYQFGCTRDAGYNVSAGIRTALGDHLQARVLLGFNNGSDMYMYHRRSTAKFDVSYLLSDRFDIVFDTKLINRYEPFYTLGARVKF